MSPLKGRLPWFNLKVLFDACAYRSHLHVRNKYNIRIIVRLWDGFLALWVVQEIKVNNEYEVVSTSRLEPEAEYIYYDLSIVCLWGR